MVRGELMENPSKSSRSQHTLELHLHTLVAQGELAPLLLVK